MNDNSTLYVPVSRAVQASACSQIKFAQGRQSQSGPKLSSKQGSKLTRSSLKLELDREAESIRFNLAHAFPALHLALARHHTNAQKLSYFPSC